jgi:hypothetical protein
MAADLNTMQLLAPTATMEPSQHLVFAVKMADVQKAVVAMTSGPDFGTGAEPVDDAVWYAATDGTGYYRPGLRIADRQPGMLAGPDVWFLKDDRGVIRLQWSLADVPPAGAPATVRPLPITVNAARLVWQGGSRTFDTPVIDPLPQTGEGKPRFLLRGGALLPPDEAANLESVMSRADSGCRLEVDYSYSYVMQVVDTPPPDPSPKDPPIDWEIHPVDPIGPRGSPRRLPMAIERAPGRIAAFQAADLAPATTMMNASVLSESPAGGAAGLAATAVADVPMARFAATAVESTTLARSSMLMMRPELLTAFNQNKVDDIIATQRSQHPDQRIRSVTRTVPFIFNPTDPPNRPIYRSLHGVASLNDQWAPLADGWVRDSGFPNTVYRLPDEIRLAFDADMGTPHVVTTLHREGDAATTVRLLMRLAPWQDPRKVVALRKVIQSEAAQVTPGPVESATLQLGGSFPEAIKILSAGAAVPISLDVGAEILMELSLEFFQLLCGMLGGKAGLDGTVIVTLTHPSGAGGTAAGPPAGPTTGPTTVPVPVKLRMDKVNDLPVSLEAPGGKLRPDSVTVTNRSNTKIRIGGCQAVFLQMDEQSIVPLGSHPARCTTSFPVEMAPNGTAALTFEAVNANPEDFWNAILVDLLDKEMVDDAAAILLKANQLAGSGELTWDLTVSCPPFAAPTMPDKWNTLSAVEVEVAAPGFTTTTVVLRKETPSKKISMTKPLVDLITGGASGIQTATFRVRNDYTDRQGQWTAPQQQSGNELIAYPSSSAD